ncbi:deoxyribodipyrimidine photo-lyase [uncultured Enterovirga sp.]|uniref:deoxyribodipyrimidine photo-lyase n=1 Tax=uncultured Enterovirga sp. TaxID=2026352 RepID=UPI0035C9FA92
MPPREGGRYVLYWMQQAMRAEGNAALDHAVELANGLGLPVVVSFGLTGARSLPYPEANARHYAFLLEGLADVAASLERRGIAFVIRAGAPDEVSTTLSEQAAILVCDRGYLRPQREWHAKAVERVTCRMVRVETDAVVPLDVVSTKHEFAARTIRPKIERLIDNYLVEHPSPSLHHKATGLDLSSDVDLSDPRKTVASLKVDQGVGPVARFRGGLTAARAQLAAFLAGGFDGYAEMRNRPERQAVSHLSPYFHFGQISPIEVALAVRSAGEGGFDDRKSYLEEAIVRRELSFNHVLYAPGYDRYDEAVPDWARKTLDEHRGDPRPRLYGRTQLEAGETHDVAWNAAMREMRETGYMHNRLRMYWGKKILEWSQTPEEAFATTLAINNRYFVDGRDANSFTNVAWLFGLHDRPWFRRPIFGTVRYMGENTLKKFDLPAYVASVDALAHAEGAALEHAGRARVERHRGDMAP